MECKDCKTDPCPEYYMLWDHLWAEANKVNLAVKRDSYFCFPEHVENNGNSLSGQLCFSCLEKRLERYLTQKDFPSSIPANHSSDIAKKIAQLPKE